MSQPSNAKGKGTTGKQTKYSSFSIAKPLKATDTKNTTAPKHGLQSLGKIGPQRVLRPANLHSLKKENSGNNPNVNLVPTGSQGWGKKEDGSLGESNGQKKEKEEPKEVSLRPNAGVAPTREAAKTNSWVSKVQPQHTTSGTAKNFQNEFPTLSQGEEEGKKEKNLTGKEEQNANPLATGPPPFMGQLPPPNFPMQFTAEQKAMFQSGQAPFPYPPFPIYPSGGRNFPMPYPYPYPYTGGKIPNFVDPSMMTRMPKPPNSAPPAQQQGEKSSIEKTIDTSQDAQDSGWAGAQEEVDYNAKLKFDESDESDDDDKKSSEEEKKTTPAATDKKDSEEQTTKNSHLEAWAETNPHQMHMQQMQAMMQNWPRVPFPGYDPQRGPQPNANYPFHPMFFMPPYGFPPNMQPPGAADPNKKDQVQSKEQAELAERKRTHQARLRQLEEDMHRRETEKGGDGKPDARKRKDSEASDSSRKSTREVPPRFQRQISGHKPTVPESESSRGDRSPMRIMKRKESLKSEDEVQFKDEKTRSSDKPEKSSTAKEKETRLFHAEKGKRSDVSDSTDGKKDNKVAKDAKPIKMRDFHDDTKDTEPVIAAKRPPKPQKTENISAPMEKLVPKSTKAASAWKQPGAKSSEKSLLKIQQEEEELDKKRSLTEKEEPSETANSPDRNSPTESRFRSDNYQQKPREPNDKPRGRFSEEYKRRDYNNRYDKSNQDYQNDRGGGSGDYIRNRDDGMRDVRLSEQPYKGRGSRPDNRRPRYDDQQEGSYKGGRDGQERRSDGRYDGRGDRRGGYREPRDQNQRPPRNERYQQRSQDDAADAQKTADKKEIVAEKVKSSDSTDPAITKDTTEGEKPAQPPQKEGERNTRTDDRNRKYEDREYKGRYNDERDGGRKYDRQRYNEDRRNESREGRRYNNEEKDKRRFNDEKGGRCKEGTYEERRSSSRRDVRTAPGNKERKAFDKPRRTDDREGNEKYPQKAKPARKESQEGDLKEENQKKVTETVASTSEVKDNVTFVDKVVKDVKEQATDESAVSSQKDPQESSKVLEKDANKSDTTETAVTSTKTDVSGKVSDEKQDDRSNRSQRDGKYRDGSSRMRSDRGDSYDPSYSGRGRGSRGRGDGTRGRGRGRGRGGRGGGRQESFAEDGAFDDDKKSDAPLRKTHIKSWENDTPPRFQNRTAENEENRSYRGRGRGGHERGRGRGRGRYENDGSSRGGRHSSKGQDDGRKNEDQEGSTERKDHRNRGKESRGGSASATRGKSTGPFLASRQQSREKQTPGYKNNTNNANEKAPTAAAITDIPKKNSPHLEAISVNSPTKKKEKEKAPVVEKKRDITREFDLSNIASVVIIDDMKGTYEERSDAKEEDEGFVTVTSKKQQKELRDKQREEEKRKLIQEQKKEQSKQKNAKKEKAVTPGSSTTAAPTANKSTKATDTKPFSDAPKSQTSIENVSVCTTTVTATTASNQAMVAMMGAWAPAQALMRPSQQVVTTTTDQVLPVNTNAWQRPLTLVSQGPDPRAVGTGKPSSVHGSIKTSLIPTQPTPEAASPLVTPPALTPIVPTTTVVPPSVIAESSTTETTSSVAPVKPEAAPVKSNSKQSSTSVKSTDAKSSESKSKEKPSKPQQEEKNKKNQRPPRFERQSKEIRDGGSRKQYDGENRKQYDGESRKPYDGEKNERSERPKRRDNKERKERPPRGEYKSNGRDSSRRDDRSRDDRSRDDRRDDNRRNRDGRKNFDRNKKNEGKSEEKRVIQQRKETNGTTAEFHNKGQERKNILSDEEKVVGSGKKAAVKSSSVGSFEEEPIVQVKVAQQMATEDKSEGKKVNGKSHVKAAAEQDEKSLETRSLPGTPPPLAVKIPEPTLSGPSSDPGRAPSPNVFAASMAHEVNEMSRKVLGAKQAWYQTPSVTSVVVSSKSSPVITTSATSDMVTSPKTEATVPVNVAGESAKDEKSPPTFPTKRTEQQNVCKVKPQQQQLPTEQVKPYIVSTDASNTRARYINEPMYTSNTYIQDQLNAPNGVATSIPQIAAFQQNHLRSVEPMPSSSAHIYTPQHLQSNQNAALLVQQQNWNPSNLQQSKAYQPPRPQAMFSSPMTNSPVIIPLNQPYSPQRSSASNLQQGPGGQGGARVVFQQQSRRNDPSFNAMHPSQQLLSHNGMALLFANPHLSQQQRSELVKHVNAKPFEPNATPPPLMQSPPIHAHQTVIPAVFQSNQQQRKTNQPLLPRHMQNPHLVAPIRPSPMHHAMNAGSPPLSRLQNQDRMTAHFDPNLVMANLALNRPQGARVHQMQQVSSVPQSINHQYINNVLMQRTNPKNNLGPIQRPPAQTAPLPAVFSQSAAVAAAQTSQQGDDFKRIQREKMLQDTKKYFNSTKEDKPADKQQTSSQQQTQAVATPPTGLSKHDKIIFPDGKGNKEKPRFDYNKKARADNR